MKGNKISGNKDYFRENVIRLENFNITQRFQSFNYDEIR